VIAHAHQHLGLLCLALTFGGFAYIYDGFFIGLGKGQLIKWAMVFASLLGFLPFAVAAIYWRRPDLLWWAMIGLMLLRTLSLAIPAHRSLRRFS